MPIEIKDVTEIKAEIQDLKLMVKNTFEALDKADFVNDEVKQQKSKDIITAFNAMAECCTPSFEGRNKKSVCL